MVIFRVFRIFDSLLLKLRIYLKSGLQNDSILKYNVLETFQSPCFWGIMIFFIFFFLKIDKARNFFFEKFYL